MKSKGDVVAAEPGEFSWMTENVNLKTTTMTAGAKGIFGGIVSSPKTIDEGQGL
jgi:uncharacterized protein (AIM24 family)